MTLPRTVADVLSRHVTFEIESIDRMYLNVYQPKLQYTAGAAAFFVGHRGFSYASSALMAQMTETFVADLYHGRRLDGGGRRRAAAGGSAGRWGTTTPAATPGR